MVVTRPNTIAKKGAAGRPSRSKPGTLFPPIADNLRSKRTRKQVPPNPDAQLSLAEQQQTAVAVERSMQAFRIHSDVDLIEWTSDYDGVDMDRIRSLTRRTGLLEELVKIGVAPPASKAAMTAYLLSRSAEEQPDTSGVGSSPAASPSSSPPASTPSTQPEKKSRKRAKTPPVSDAEEEEDSTSEVEVVKTKKPKPSQQPINPRCPHCGDPGLAVGEVVCHWCGMRPDLPFACELNAFLRSIRASAARGVTAPPVPSTPSVHSSQSLPSSSSSSSPPPGLSTHESTLVGNLTELMTKNLKNDQILTQQQKEENMHLTRLQQARPNPHFASIIPPATSLGLLSYAPITTPVPTDTALDQLQQRFEGGVYTRPSPAIIALIQTGVLKNIADCVPRTLASEITYSEAGSSMKMLFKDSGISVSGGIPQRKLESMDQLFRAFLCTIIPALSGQPQALLNWTRFIATVDQLKEKHGWAVAHAFLQDVMYTKAGTGNIGELDLSTHLRLMSTIQMPKPPSTNATPSQQPAPRPRSVAQPSSGKKARHSGGYQQPLHVVKRANTVASVREDVAPHVPSVPERDSRGYGPRWDLTAADPGACRNWNAIGGCSIRNCHRSHRCLWRACTNKDPEHRGYNCQHVRHQGSPSSQA